MLRATGRRKNKLLSSCLGIAPTWQRGATILNVNPTQSGMQKEAP